MRAPSGGYVFVYMNLCRRWNGGMARGVGFQWFRVPVTQEAASGDIYDERNHRRLPVLALGKGQSNTMKRLRFSR